jgi:hypothetical protein
MLPLMTCDLCCNVWCRLRLCSVQLRSRLVPNVELKQLLISLKYTALLNWCLIRDHYERRFWLSWNQYFFPVWRIMALIVQNSIRNGESKELEEKTVQHSFKMKAVWEDTWEIILQCRCIVSGHLTDFNYSWYVCKLILQEKWFSTFLIPFSKQH